MSGTAVWLVDMGYVVKAAASRFKLDYVRARDLLRTRFGPVEVFLFNGYDESIGVPSGLQAFYAAMGHQGMTVRLHPMAGSSAEGDHRQRRVDVDLAAHLVWQASLPGVDRIVLTSGDQDFLPAVTLVQRAFGKPVVLFAFDRNVHRSLAAAANERLDFEAVAQEISRS